MATANQDRGVTPLISHNVELLMRAEVLTGHEEYDKDIALDALPNLPTE